MNPDLKALYRRIEGRYLDDAEANQLQEFAEGTVARLAVAAAIENAEKKILDDVVAKVMGGFPAIPKDHGGDAEQRVRRDQMMVLRYATHAMVAHEPSYIYDKLSVWLKTILVALVPPEYVMLGYNALLEACEKHLSAGDYAALLPYLTVHINEFGSAMGGRAS